MEICKNYQVSIIFWEKDTFSTKSINKLTRIAVCYLGSVWLNILWKPLWQMDILFFTIIFPSSVMEAI